MPDSQDGINNPKLDKTFNRLPCGVSVKDLNSGVAVGAVESCCKSSQRASVPTKSKSESQAKVETAGWPLSLSSRSETFLEQQVLAAGSLGG